MKKLLFISSLFATVAGFLLVFGGVWGIYFTHNNITRENITTPSDATFPDQPVRGPLTLKSQADIIREHTLQSTDGKTFAEMPREDAKRNLWITATTLTTALHLGILTYAFSGFIILIGCISIWTGLVFYTLRNTHQDAPTVKI